MERYPLTNTNIVFLKSTNILMFIFLVTFFSFFALIIDKTLIIKIKISKNLIFLFFITLIGFGLRLLFINVPITNETPDEWHNILRILIMLYSYLDPNYFIHPSLFFYMCGTLYSLLYHIGNFPNDYAFLHFFIANENAFVITCRFVSLIFSTLSIPLIFKLGRLIWNEKIGLISSLIFMLLPLHLTYSHRVKVDSVFIFFVILSFYFIYKLFLTKSLKYYLISGVLVGLTLSTNYNGGLLIVFMVVAHFLSLDNGPKLSHSRLFVAGLLSLLTFLLTSPYVILNYPMFLKQFTFQSKLSFVFHPFSEKRLWPYYFSIIFEQGKLFTFVSLAGFLLFLKNERKKLVFLFFPLLYLIIFTLIKSKYDRFILPVFPFLALIAAYFIGGALTSKKIPRTILISLCVLLCGEMAVKDISDAILLNKRTRDPRTDVRDYIIKHIPERSKIFIQADILPLEEFIFVDGNLKNDVTSKLYHAYKKFYRTPDYTWVKCQFIEGDKCYSLDLLKEVDYLIITSSVEEYIMSYRNNYKRIADFFNYLSRNSSLIKIFQFKRPVNSIWQEVKIYKNK